MKRQILAGRGFLGGVLLLGWMAQSFAGGVSVSDAWVRATAPGQESAAVSLHIQVMQDAKLVSVSTPAAQSVELHVMTEENGMMLMRRVEKLPLPKNQEVVLGSGSHLMLMGLKQPLRVGDKVELKLTIEYPDKRKESVAVIAAVQPLDAVHDMHGTGSHDMHHHSH